MFGILKQLVMALETSFHVAQAYSRIMWVCNNWSEIQIIQFPLTLLEYSPH